VWKPELELVEGVMDIRMACRVVVGPEGAISRAPSITSTARAMAGAALALHAMVGGRWSRALDDIQ
jgi:hypothetical protein